MLTPQISADFNDEDRFDFRGQLSGWTNETRKQETWENHSGLRYIPDVSLKLLIEEYMVLDTYLSINSHIAYDSNANGSNTDVELYRAQLRFLTRQTETCIGLQKINFGPAHLLRPLRWFDQLDPRDPLQLTDGIYALRFKYNALNNANLWLWLLYGNEDPKGYESAPTASGKPEFGGRFQYPLFQGEMAATFHSRQVDGSEPYMTSFTENRFAFDGRWDIGIGLWFEAVAQHQTAEFSVHDWTKWITLGMDYTITVGNGLYFLVEHMTIALSDALLQWDEDVQTTAYSLNYPVGYFDQLMAIGYYSWDRKQYYQYLGWQRTFDSWIFQLSFFHYPQSSGQVAEVGSDPLGTGYGGQLMIIFNH